MTCLVTAHSTYLPCQSTSLASWKASIYQFNMSFVGRIKGVKKRDITYVHIERKAIYDSKSHFLGDDITNKKLK